MSNVKPVTGIRNQMQKIYNTLRFDEELLRLLHYPKNPLSNTNENIMNSEKQWEVIEEHIIFGEKDSDIKDSPICRIYLYTGRRRQVFGRPYYARQRFFINVIIHEKYSDGLRLEQITDRVNQLLLHNQITGFSNIMLEGGDPYQAPREFQTYLLSYSFLMRNETRC